MDWFTESLRRALVCAVLVLIASAVDLWGVRLACGAALVVFLFFLVRNPDGWARRLSYACIMLGAAAFLPLGREIKAWAGITTANSNATLLGSLVVDLGQNSPWPGLALIAAGVAFGVIQLLREHWRQPESAAASGPLLLRAEHVGKGRHEVDFALRVRNPREHDITIRRPVIEPWRLLDRVMVSRASIDNPVSIEGDPPENRVELPATITPGAWKRLELELAFTDRLEPSSSRVLRAVRWLLGLNRRYLRLRLEDNPDDSQIERTLIVSI
jgi:hypothetical protein